MRALTVTSSYSSGRKAMALAAATLLTFACAGLANAQTRTAEIAKQQEEKAQAAAPFKPTRAEVLVGQVERSRLFGGVPRGWYPGFGSVAPGGGLAAGAGYRHYIGYDSFVDASALYSIYGYKTIQLTGFTPHHVHGRVDLSGTLGWLDATQMPYYGLGISSDQNHRSNYRLNRTYMLGAAVVRPVGWLRLRLDGGIDDYTQKRGHGDYPSIEQLFTPATAPLLGEHPRYLRGQVSASVYWLQAPLYSRKGGLYAFAYEEFNPLRGSGDTFGFARSEIVQHLPIRRETWVVSLRARTESIVRESDLVPYFLMPALGGGTTLRGYDTDRFHDRHSLLLSSELRWFPNRAALDMALFLDAGKVAPRASGLTLDGMKTNYGVGVRFHTPTITTLRLDLARSHEGWRLVFAAGPAF